MEKLICPSCGVENPAGNSSCQSCGKPLVQVPPAESDRTVLSNRGAQAQVVPPPPSTEQTIMTPPAEPIKTPEMVPPPPPVMNAAPVPPPPPPPTYAYFQTTSIKSLGVYTDGWSDVIEGGAPLAEKVKQEFENNLKAAEIPGLHIAESTLAGENGETRKYQVVSFGKGMTVAVRTAPMGKHLVVSWDLFTKQSFNWLTLGILGGAVLVLAFLTHILGGLFYGAFFSGFFGWLATFINWLLVPGLAIMLAGKILRGDWLAFYIREQDEFAADDAIALATIVDDALSDAVDKALEEE